MRTFLTLFAFSIALSCAIAQDLSPERQRALKALQSGDEKTFVEIHEKLMKDGSSDSQVLLGQYYLKKNDFVRAEQLLKPLAEKGNIDAQFHLGGAYLLQNPPKSKDAAEWFKRAADKGHYQAKIALEGMTRPMPKVIVKDGKASTLQMLEVSIPEFREGFRQRPEGLKCYKIDQTQFSGVFDPVASACTQATVDRYGREITY